MTDDQHGSSGGTGSASGGGAGQGTGGRSSGHGGAATLSLIYYDEDSFDEEELQDVDDLADRLDRPGTKWLNVANTGSDHELLRRIADVVGLHPLALDDILHEGQRPRAEEYGDQVFLLMRMLLVREIVVPPSADAAHDTRSGRAAKAALDRRSKPVAEAEEEGGGAGAALPEEVLEDEYDKNGLRTGQVALVVKENLVITFLETRRDPFDELRDMLRESHGPVRRLGPDFLAYRLVEVIISQYFTVVERYGENLEALEDRILLNPTHAVFRQVNGLRRDLLQARRAIWPLRDALLRLQQGDSGLLSQETMTYLRDAQSHVMQVIETLELLREMVSGLHDVYLTALNTRMNDIMKVLTIISTIFIPLTFLAGIYGMNFEHQPEYGWRWAYPALWGLMLVLVGFMLYLFRRKRWI